MSGVEKALAFAKDEGSRKLGLVFGGKDVGNGMHVPKADAQSPPQLRLDNPEGLYVVVGIDLDVPYMSFPVLGPILHWVQPGLRGSNSPSASPSNSAVELNAADNPFVADYVAPGPPPLAAPHRYLFLLYNQPENFDGKKFGQPEEGKKFPITSRMRFDLDGFVRDAKLGEIVAANWFESN